MKLTLWMLAFVTCTHAYAVGPFDPGPFDIEQPTETDGSQVQRELASS